VHELLTHSIVAAALLELFDIKHSNVLLRKWANSMDKVVQGTGFDRLIGAALLRNDAISDIITKCSVYDKNGKVVQKDDMRDLTAVSFTKLVDVETI
jgi:hypothetical protein